MKKIAVIILILFTFTLTGCWDSVETEELGIVSIIGIKLVNNETQVTIEELSNKGQGIVSQAGSDGKTPYYIFSATAPTISEALEKISSSQHQKLYFAHTRVLVVDEEYANSKGISPIIDFCKRTIEMRFTAPLLVSKHDVIDKIFTQNNVYKTDAGTFLDEKIHNQNSVFINNVKNIEDITESTNNIGNIAYTAGIEDFPSASESSSGNEFDISDTAVFKNCKLVGWLNKDQSIGLACINEKIKDTVLSIPYKDGSVSINIIKLSSKIKPKLIDDKIQFNIVSEVKSNITKSNVNIDFSDDNNIRTLEELINKKIKSEIISTIEESKGMNIDILGFNNYINMYFHSYWQGIEKQWISDYYPNVKINITVNSVIKNLGKVYKTFH